ncbi:MAG: hypothetical protein V1652_03330, partial [bacterium]
MVINLYAIINLVAALITASLVIVLFFGSKGGSARVFAMGLFFFALWFFMMGVFFYTKDQSTAAFISKITYYLGTVIACFMFYLSLVFPEEKKPNKWIKIILITIEISILPVFLFTSLIIKGAFALPPSSSALLGWELGKLSFLFDVVYNVCFISMFYIWFKKMRKLPKGDLKRSLQIILLVFAIGVIPPSILSVYLPMIGNYEWNWLPSITVVIWVSIVAYTIAKHKLMNVKAVIAEVFILVMAGILLMNIFVSNIIGGILGRILIFGIFVATGVFFIKSVLREAEQKEQLQDLNEHLEEKVTEQTIEIRKAYEVEKKARHDLEALDQAKTDFILTTQHHLRTPLTVIKGMLSMLQ